MLPPFPAVCHLVYGSGWQRFRGIRKKTSGTDCENMKENRALDKKYRFNGFFFEAGQFYIKTPGLRGRDGA